MRDLECTSAPRKIVYNTGMCWHRFATAMSPSVLPLSTPPTSAPLFSPETDLWSLKGFKSGKVSKVGKFQMWESFKCGKVSNVGEFQKWESFLTWLLLSSLLCLSSTKGEVWPNLRIKIQETFKSWENKMLSSSCKDSRLSNFNQWESFSEFSLKISQICFSHFYSKFPFLIDRCQHILLKKSLYTAQVKNVTASS